MSAKLLQQRILVVDDEIFVRESLRMMLRVDGHEVETVGDAEAALASIERRRFDLIITDHSMPSMDGSQLAAIIKKRNPRQPVVMVTAWGESLPEQPSGVDLVLGKPFSLKELRDAVARAVVPLTGGQPRIDAN